MDRFLLLRISKKLELGLVNRSVEKTDSSYRKKPTQRLIGENRTMRRGSTKQNTFRGQNRTRAREKSSSLSELERGHGIPEQVFVLVGQRGRDIARTVQ